MSMTAIYNIQMSSKTKNGNQKELKHIKSMQNLPLGSLMQEIGQLKKELIQIKQSKKKDTLPNNRNVQSHISPKENYKTRQSTNADLSIISNKEYRYKLELELQKIKRELQSLQSKAGQICNSSINEITQQFCLLVSELTSQKESLKSQLASIIEEKEKEVYEQDQKFAVLMRNNKKLEKEVEELRSNMLMKLKDREYREAQLVLQYDSQSQLIQELKREIKELTKANLELQSLVDEWQLQCRQLQENRIAHQSIINAREEQVRAFQQDVQYLRIQSQKFKAQKKEFEKLWEKSSLELKDLKKAYEEELVKAERERNRWMNQCAFRRHESEQIQAIQAEKELLFKQVQQTRNNYTLKCRQLAQKSALLHDMQRKMISLQSQNFKLANESDRLRRQTGYWSNEMTQLRQEVNKLNDAKGFITKHVQSGEKRNRETKMKAINDIFNLIKSQRQEEGSEKV